MSWPVITITICLVLAAYLVWQECRRVNRSRLPLRILVTVLGVVAFACIALPLTYPGKTWVGNADGVLLTKGFDAGKLPAYKSGKLLTTDLSIQKAYPKLKIELVADLSDIPQGKRKLNKLHILGYGLNGDELKKLEQFPVEFDLVQQPAGITHINWNRSIKSGEPLQVQGTFAESKTKTTLILKGLNTGLDSVIIPVGSSQSFSLKTTPKNTGRATYTLLAINGKDTIERETIPFEVTPAKPLKVLMLATAPDFENRFLKNWLAQHGNGVAVRTAISKDKFSREYLNTEQINVDRVTTSLLEKFDVVAGDLSAFRALSSAENSALQQQMAQKGLGVIVKADSTGKGATFLTNAFGLDRLANKDQKSFALNIAGLGKPTAKLTLDATFIKPQPNTQPLVTDEQAHTIVSSTIYGSGKIVFSALGTTYNWVLSGNQNDYNNLWTLLIDKTSRKANSTVKWDILPVLPAVDEQVDISVSGISVLPAQIKVDKTAIAFAQNPILPFNFTATYWPDNYGWQQVTQNGVPVYWWYTFKPTEWVTLRATETIAQTKRYLEQNTNQAIAATREESNIQIPVPKIYFYLLLLVCCTFLWVEGKLQ